MKKDEEKANSESTFKNLWYGIGSAWKTVKNTTLNFVDSLQDQIMALDAQMEARNQNSQPINNSIECTTKKNVDPIIIPILENPTIYLTEPNDHRYFDYLSNFELAFYQEDILLFLDNSSNLRRIHSRLVPSALEEKIFWARLFYKLENNNEESFNENLSQNLSESQKNNDSQNTNISNNNIIINSNEIELTPEELAELDKLTNSDDDWDN